MWSATSVDQRLPVLLVLVEGWNRTPHPLVPPAPIALRQARPPVFVLSSHDLSDQLVMYWSTENFPTIVNGGSGFRPARLQQIRQLTATFPDQPSVSLLRKLGVHSMIILRNPPIAGLKSDALSTSIAGLNLDRRDTGSAVIFTLR
jgi:hypothetical protein